MNEIDRNEDRQRLSHTSSVMAQWESILLKYIAVQNAQDVSLDVDRGSANQDAHGLVDVTLEFRLYAIWIDRKDVYRTLAGPIVRLERPPCPR